MPTEKGIIEKVDTQKAFVRIQKNTDCAHCASRGMCQIDNEREMVVEVENRLEAGPGDRVEIMVPTGSFMKISLMVYMLPVLAFMFGAFMGDGIARKIALNPSFWAIITGTGLMVIVFYALKRLDKVMGGNQKYMPRMTRIIGRGDKKSVETCEAVTTPSLISHHKTGLT